MNQFAIDLQKHKLGEDISTTPGVVDDAKQPASNTTKPKVVLDEAAAQRREIEAREKRRREVEAIAAQKRIEEEMAKQQQQRRREEEEAEANKMKQLEMEKKKAANTSTNPQKKNEGSLKPIKSNMKSPPTKSTVVTKKQTPKSQTKKQQSKPQRGKPLNKLCGCYGNKHKPLTNCLHCGRISCEIEGFDYCHFCGYLIQDFSSAREISDRENNIDSAIRHKERLLEFDRTSASRTHVHDDQEDYFVTSSNMWATSEEQDDARDMEEKRRQKLHTRQKQRLDIKF